MARVASLTTFFVWVDGEQQAAIRARCHVHAISIVEHAFPEAREIAVYRRTEDEGGEPMPRRL